MYARMIMVASLPTNRGAQVTAYPWMPETRALGADFGLAVFFEAGQLPRTDLGLEGTPWFLAPENLDSEFYPASDLWSAGVMAFQLLSGFMPFDDRRNRGSPALSQVCLM